MHLNSRKEELFCRSWVFGSVAELPSWRGAAVEPSGLLIGVGSPAGCVIGTGMAQLTWGHDQA